MVIIVDGFVSPLSSRFPNTWPPVLARHPPPLHSSKASLVHLCHIIIPLLFFHYTPPIHALRAGFHKHGLPLILLQTYGNVFILLGPLSAPPAALQLELGQTALRQENVNRKHMTGYTASAYIKIQYL